MRITNSGDYEYCRWVAQKNDHRQNISQIHPIEWFQNGMSSVRQAQLEGKRLDLCEPCYRMEQHGKISGRQRQLLKTGVVLQDFTKSMQSSSWMQAWSQSQQQQGRTNLHVQDWQIDLGNFCNSACVFCVPEYSSRLAVEYKKLGIIDKLPPSSWCDDPNNLKRFLDTLQQSPNLQYLHFLGGETLITPAFKIILQAVIDVGLNDNLSIGFTTNLTVMSQDIVDLLSRFHQVNLGMSIECLDPTNDYIRYGSTYARTRNLLDRWIAIGKERDWLIQIRTTPTILSISKLHTIYEYAWNNLVNVESCNFLHRPEFMRASVLPGQYRQQAIDSMKNWINSKDVPGADEQLVNTRHPDFVHVQLLQDAISYIRYLEDEPDESSLLPDLVNYLKLLESNRQNSVLDYLPEYEELFRSAGY